MKLLKYSLMAMSLLALISCDDTHKTTTATPGPTYRSGSNSQPVKTTSEVPAADASAGEQPAQPEHVWETTAKQQEFVQKTRELIASLKLPDRAPFDMQGSDQEEAKHFVTIRCALFVHKLRTAPKGPTNLYDDEKLKDVCSGDFIRLIPGKSIASVSSFGVFSTETTVTEIAIRPDFTVSGYRRSFIGPNNLVETVVIDGGRKIEATGSTARVDALTVTDLKGRYTYVSQRESSDYGRSEAIHKGLTYAMPSGRKLHVVETDILKDDYDSTSRSGCNVDMENADGSSYVYQPADGLCF